MMHIRDQKNQITSMDKNIDLIINSNSSDPNKHIAKRVTSNRSPRDNCIENQKRERNPSSYCLRTRRSTKNYSRIIGEGPMEVVNPSVTVSRLDLVFLDSAVSGLIFRRLF